MTRSRVAFLIPELGRSGGINTIVGWASRLAAGHAFDTELVVCDPRQPSPPSEVGGVPARRLDEARGEAYDLAVATWWATVAALQELEARRRVAFMLNVEHRFYRPRELPDLAGAAAVLAKPLDFLCIAEFMRRLMADLRPDARCLLVRPGIDKSVFRARPRDSWGGPLRVLVEGQPTLWFKGVQDAIAAVRGMSEPAELTLVVQDASGVDEPAADRIEAPREPQAMADLYAEHDVQVKLPRFEGLGLPPIEGFHAGLPCVASPFTAHDEYMEHGVNGLVVGFDDLPGASAALDLLARRRDLLARLSEGALATAARWPDSEASTAELARALETIAREPPPEPDLVHAERMERLFTELGRIRLAELEGRFAWSEHELADTRATLDGANEELYRARHDLEQVLDSRAYRYGAAARRLVRWRRSG